MPLQRKLNDVAHNMRLKIKLYGYRRFFLKQIVGMFIVELTIAFALFRGFGTVLAISKIAKIMPKDPKVTAQSLGATTNMRCSTAVTHDGQSICY